MPFVRTFNREKAMKRTIFLGLLAITSVLNAQNINVLYAFRTYHSPQVDYAEINTSIEASSLRNTLTSSGKYIKQAELTTVICPLDNIDSAVYAEKRIIQTPQTEDSASLNNVSLMDMQRIALKNGKYVVFFELRDINTAMQPMTYKDAIVMNYPKDEINVADIMIIDKYEKTSKENIFSKGGYDFHPYIFDVIGKNDNKINYYTEIYNADKTFGRDSVFAIWTIIEDINTNKRVEGLQVVKRQKAESITPYFSTVDLTTLVEGSYYLTVEVRDKNNVLYAYKRYPFYKQSEIKIIPTNVDIPQNAFVNNIPDSLLKESIRSLVPIASDSQKKYIKRDLKESTPEQDRYFIYQFFKSINSIEPEQAWREYTAQVETVNKKYSTHIKKGYNTDMGRILLLYGNPDEIIDEKFATSGGVNNVDKFQQRMNPDLSSSDSKGVYYYPYQIWVYNHTPFGENNRKFVFYAKQDNMSEYFLLHSNAVGELQDLQWENVLSHGTLDPGIVGKAGKQFERGYK